MAQEINLMVNYPHSNRNVEARGRKKTESDRLLARQFGEAFFDGDRAHGYGGFSYNPRFWSPVIPTLQKHFGLTPQSRVLDVGCVRLSVGVRHVPAVDRSVLGAVPTWFPQAVSVTVVL